MTDREAQMREAGVMMDVQKATDAMAVGDTALALIIYGRWSDEDILFVQRNRFGRQFIAAVHAIPEQERDEILGQMEDDLSSLEQSFVDPPMTVRIVEPQQ